MKAKIYERNPDTGQIRWRYVDESHDKFGWPNYGRILKQKTETWIFEFSWPGPYNPNKLSNL